MTTQKQPDRHSHQQSIPHPDRSADAAQSTSLIGAPDATSTRADTLPIDQLTPPSPDYMHLAQRQSMIMHLGRILSNQDLSRAVTHIRAPSESLLVQRVLHSPRFQNDAQLMTAYNETAYLQIGSRGTAVTKLQQALVELNFPLPRYGVDGIFHNETKTAVRAFQRTHHLQVDGLVGPETLGRLDQLFADYAPQRQIAQQQAPGIRAPERGWAAGSEPPALLAGTRTLSTNDRAAINQELSPTPTINPATGLPPTFHTDIPTGNFEQRLRTQLNLQVTAQFNGMARGRAAQRSDAANLHGWDQIEVVAKVAKQETDKVFGSYATGPTFTRGVNLIDRWDEQETRIGAMTPDQQHDIGEWRVEKILREDEDVKTILTEHGAIRSRSPEEDIILKLKDEIATARLNELLEIHKAWPGAADPLSGKVFLQRFKGSNDRQNRSFMWETFQTMIHEYIHTLAHRDYYDYADSLPLDKGHTLREGMTDYFTKIVWYGINLGDVSLQKQIEGSYHDPTITHPVPRLGTYDEADNAERLASIAGVRNAYAAYFLGHTDLIGRT